ncbi:MAG: DUF6537 domain-containing protein, partial [Pseudomonadota bacterium]
AQKGGAVHIHCRIADAPDGISAIRVATGECDALIGGDLVVSAGAKTLGLTSTGRTGAVVNSHETITGDFTRDTDFRIPADRLILALTRKLREGVSFFDASTLAAELVGDAIFSNMMVFGAAWQRGLIPVSGAAIRKAIELNGTAVAKNLEAFDLGRWVVINPEKVAEIQAREGSNPPAGIEDIIAQRVDHLRAYQSDALASRYLRALEAIDDPVLQEAVARGYHKALAYKDEYEVARLLTTSREKAEAVFEGDLKLTYHLAPPFLSPLGSDGRPKKRAFGTLIEKVFPVLARLKMLRGTPLDPFGYTEERQMERQLIREYEADLTVLRDRAHRHPEAARELAELPLSIRGFGPVKAANARAAAVKRRKLLSALEAGAGAVREAAE